MNGKKKYFIVALLLLLLGIGVITFESGNEDELEPVDRSGNS